jgi:hypothetical protein
MEAADRSWKADFEAQNEKSSSLPPVVQFSRRASAQRHPENEAQIERTHMNQLPLQDVIAAPQIDSSHSAGIVTVGKRALDEFAAFLQ